MDIFIDKIGRSMKYLKEFNDSRINEIKEKLNTNNISRRYIST